jgi:hypothetical protein
VVRAFGKDRRVLGWDVWNEPDNMNTNSYADVLALGLVAEPVCRARAVRMVSRNLQARWRTYKQDEVDLIRKLTGAPVPASVGR